MDELEFFDGGGGEEEGVEVGQAHAAVEGIEGAGEGKPVLEDLRKRGVEGGGLGGVGGHEPGVGVGGVEGDAEADGGFDGVDDVEVVGPGFGPIFPRMGAGVGADVAVLPVGGGAALIIAEEGGGVVPFLVAEKLAEAGEAGRPGDELVPVVMGDLVTEMAEEGAVGFVQADALALAFLIVGFGDVDGDLALGVAGERGRTEGGLAEKTEAEGRAVLGGDAVERKAEAEEGVDHAALGGFEFAPAFAVAPDMEVGDHFIEAAGEAVGVGVGGGDEPVAEMVQFAVATEAVAGFAGGGMKGAPGAVGGGGEAGEVVGLGEKTEGAAAADAGDVFKEDEAAAGVAVKDFHARGLGVAAG